MNSYWWQRTAAAHGTNGWPSLNINIVYMNNLFTLPLEFEDNFLTNK